MADVIEIASSDEEVSSKVEFSCCGSFLAATFVVCFCLEQISARAASHAPF